MRDWTGTILMGDEWALFVGAGGRTPMHRHLAFKLVIGLDGPVAVMDEGGECRRGRTLAVRPNAVHQVVAEAQQVGLFFADAGAYPNPAPLKGRAVAALVAQCRRLAGGEHDISASLRNILKLDARCTTDARVVSTVGQLRQPSEVRMDALAADVGLSHSRLSHLFSEVVGGSPVRYRKWRRLRRAAQQLGVGATITDAALEAGFSDAAHLTRTFVEMLGITPGLFQASRVVLLDVP